jgi:glyoxylase-like metal-dependent hydrolase (beta-lactamase superfamily II)
MAQPTFTPVTPHIAKLDLPFLGGRQPVGVWLVQDEAGGWVMIDAGAPGFEKLVLEQVLAHTGGQRPQLLVLTHGHLDHAAAAERVRDTWNVPIAAHRAEIPYLLGPARYAAIPARHPLYRLLQISPPPLVGRNVQLPLDEGQRLPGGLQVYHAPGHAPGMIALLHPADRALIAADAFMTLGRLRDPYALFTYDPRLNHATQARLADLDFDHLLVSHGPPLLNTGRQQARDLIASRTKKRGRAAAPAAAKPR